jgi:hypothetical protein
MTIRVSKGNSVGCYGSHAEATGGETVIAIINDESSATAFRLEKLCDLGDSCIRRPTEFEPTADGEVAVARVAFDCR